MNRIEVTIPFYQKSLPHLTTEQMIEVDRAMIEDFRISLVQMMENAGRNLAFLARQRFLADQPQGKRVVVLAGSGGNGGGAMVCARRLNNYGASVEVILTEEGATFAAVPALQLSILRRMGVTIRLAGDATDVSCPELIIDGVIGYSLKGAPRGGAASLITWANDQETPILALDVPSGVDTGSGHVYEPAIEAMATMTLALPKAGLRQPNVAKMIGELYLADISVPPQLYAGPGLEMEVDHIFAKSDIVRLR